MTNKLLIIIFIFFFSFVHSQELEFQKIVLHGTKTIKPIGNCTHNIDSMKVVLVLKIEKSNNKISGQEYLYNKEKGEYNLISNLNWKGEKIDEKKINLNYNYKSECEGKFHEENVNFIGELKCIDEKCNLELVDEFSMCPTNQCNFQIKYKFSSEINSYPVNFKDNLIEELSNFKENDERISNFYAFDGKIIQVMKGYNGKPIFQLELSSSSEEWIPSNKRVWIGAMMSSPENIKTDNFVRVLGLLIDIQKDDKLVKNHVKDQNYMFYGFALYNLITQNVVSFEAGLNSAKLWKNGEIPPPLKK